MSAVLAALGRWWRRRRARRRVRARMLLPCLAALAMGLAAAGCERPSKYIFVPEPQAEMPEPPCGRDEAGTANPCPPDSAGPTDPAGSVR
jgi:hypothetical protein